MERSLPSAVSLFGGQKGLSVVEGTSPASSVTSGGSKRPVCSGLLQRQGGVGTARKVDEIRLLPPVRVPMTDEQNSEAVELFAQLLLDAARRRALDKSAASVGVPAGASTGVSPVVAAGGDQAGTPLDSRRSGNFKKPTYKEEHE
jgi:hypothetical protein